MRFKKKKESEEGKNVAGVMYMGSGLSRREGGLMEFLTFSLWAAGQRR